MTGVDTAALREQVTRWMRDDDGCANSIPASPDDVLALLDECDRLAHEVDHALCVEVLGYALDGLE